MVLTCGDRESPSQIMRFSAVVGNSVLLSAVVTGGLPQLCPSEIGERIGRHSVTRPGRVGRCCHLLQLHPPLLGPSTVPASVYVLHLGLVGESHVWYGLLT